MRVLMIHHTSLLAIRSHQWKYCLDPYESCDFNCTYCFRGQPEGGLPRVRPDLFAALEQDLAGLPAKQIVFVSPRVDPYPGIEKREQVTRRVLEILLKYDMPLVILTKSPLILRDLDLLQEFHKRGSLLVQFSLITTDTGKIAILEKHAPPPEERLEASRQLSRLGVPVHFHLSPYIPGIYADGEIEDTVQAIADHGGCCIYTNAMGIRPSNREATFQALELIGEPLASNVRQSYPPMTGKDVLEWLPEYNLLIPEMLRLKNACRSAGVSFVCEFIPEFDWLRAKHFSGGVFRFGIPAVYDMMHFWDDKGTAPVDWDTFDKGFLANYGCPDPEYKGMIKRLWDRGELFSNTRLILRHERGQVLYARGSELQIKNPRPSRQSSLPLRSTLGLFKRRGLALWNSANGLFARRSQGADDGT